jgi:hypothetical protein
MRMGEGVTGPGSSPPALLLCSLGLLVGFV